MTWFTRGLYNFSKICSACTNPSEDKELEQDFSKNKNNSDKLGFLFDSKNPKYSSHSKASEIINEQNQDLGFVAAAEEIQQLLDSLVYGALMGVGLSENC